VISRANLKSIFIILLICLPIFACQRGLFSEPSPTVEPTPTIAPSPTVEYWSADIIPVSLIEEITGIWKTETRIGYYYIEIKTDGTFIIATTLEGITSGSAHSWNIILENSLITADGYVMCANEAGMYFANIRDDGSLKFTAIHDPCLSRAMLMDKSHQGGLDSQALVYTRVD